MQLNSLSSRACRRGELPAPHGPGRLLVRKDLSKVDGSSAKNWHPKDSWDKRSNQGNEEDGAHSTQAEPRSLVLEALAKDVEEQRRDYASRRWREPAAFGSP